MVAVVLSAAACRAAPIPEAARYPAGTAFRATLRVVDGSRLRVIDTGRGTPVVLMHGLGASIYSWRKTLPALAAAGYRVVAFDNRGFGSSDKPAHGYTNDDYARLVVALMDTLRLPSAVLVGHSMGGAIAAEVALMAADRVQGLALVDAAGLGVREPWALRLARLPLVGALATWLRGRGATARILRSTFADPDKVSEQDIDEYYAPVAEAEYPRALRGVLREFRFDGLAGRLEAVRAPTLVVWGAADRWIPPSIGRRLTSELPRAAFVVIPGAGHNVQEEAADEFNRTLLTFLKNGLRRVPENLAGGSGLGGWRRGLRRCSFFNHSVEEIESAS